MEKSLLVVSPFLVPNILVLEHFGEDRFLAVIEPKLAKGFNFWFQSVDHAQNTNSRAKPILGTNIQVRPIQMEGTVAGFCHLPVLIVEMKIVNIRVLCTQSIFVSFLLLVFQLVYDGQVWHLWLQFFHEIRLP